MFKKKKEVANLSGYDKEVKDIEAKEKAIKGTLKEDIKQEKLAKKQLQEDIKKQEKRRKAKSSLPKTTQQTVPYIADYEYGMIEIEPNKYSICFDFSDVNYQVARMEDQVNIFLRWCDCLNYFGSDIKMSYTIHNKSVNAVSLFDTIKIAPLEGHEEECEAFNSMLKHQFKFGRNEIQKEKYMTVTIDADNPYDALHMFNRVEAEIVKNLAYTGSIATRQSTERRLEILHDLYRPENIGDLHLDWDNIKSQGLSSKDYIAPSSMYFKRDCFKIDDVWYGCANLGNLPASLMDTVIRDLTDFSFPLMCTVSIKAMERDVAVKLVKRQITGMEAMKIEAQKKAVKSGYDPELAINHELKLCLEEAEMLLENIQVQNQKLFAANIIVCYSGKTMEELEQNYLTIAAVARKNLCQLQKIKFQQEQAFSQVLPLGHNNLKLNRTLPTESLGVFIPFTSQELKDKKGVYYSLNSITKNMIMVDRKKLNNPNGMILGESGSGKTFVVKKEILSTFLTLPEENIFIIDPESEYTRLIEKLGGQVIKIGVGTKNHMNLFDMNNEYAINGDPVAEKVDFILSVCEIMTRGLDKQQMSIIDHVVGLIYSEFLQTYDKNKLPTLENFYNKLMEQEEQQAKELALAIRTYATGSLSIFAKKTNVNLDNRLVCFDISSLGANLRSLGLLVISEFIWNKLCENRNKISTSVYIDEFHLMFKNETSENMAEQLFARIRKYGGKVTGITQNVDTLLASEKARGMLSNSLFTIMLSQSDYNRKILAEMFSIGEEQLSYIANAEKGTGLIRAGGVIVPFGDVFPKENKLYRYMTSNPDEIKEFDKLEEEEKEKEEINKIRQKERELIEEQKKNEIYNELPHGEEVAI